MGKFARFSRFFLILPLTNKQALLYLRSRQMVAFTDMVSISVKPRTFKQACVTPLRHLPMVSQVKSVGVLPYAGYIHMDHHHNHHHTGLKHVLLCQLFVSKFEEPANPKVKKLSLSLLRSSPDWSMLMWCWWWMVCMSTYTHRKTLINSKHKIPSLRPSKTAIVWWFGNRESTRK